MDSAYRQLPSVDRVLSHPSLAALRQTYPHQLVADLIRRELDGARQRIAAGDAAPSVEAVAAAVVTAAAALEHAGPRPVINATGVIIHTNLGRAPLSDDALAAMAAVAGGYSDLEFDVASGERGQRYAHVEPLLCQLTGAEAAFVVNNNASAVLLGLTALAAGREVVVSRGQAVEIGGGFRIPDVMAQSGARLVEVGTTNRTYLADYEAAITSSVLGGAALLRVHTSNFRVVGFTHAVPLAEMAALARRFDLLLLDDIGSGCLLDTAAYGLAPEPRVQDSVAAGADLVFFSADKLLGGPQAGIVVGRREPMERLRRHPLARAVRIDKLTLAALAATLRHYLRGEATAKIPVWQMIAMPVAAIEARALTWAAALGDIAAVADGRSMVGGGSLPEESLPTKLLVVHPRRLSAEALATALRRHDPPVVARIEADAVVLDPRTVLPRDDAMVVEALRETALP